MSLPVLLVIAALSLSAGDRNQVSKLSDFYFAPLHVIQLNEITVSKVYKILPLDSQPWVKYQRVDLVFDIMASEPIIETNHAMRSVTYTFSKMFTSGIESGMHISEEGSTLVRAYYLNTNAATLTLYFTKPVGLQKQIKGKALIIIVLAQY